jgi:hypothetical protein
VATATLAPRSRLRSSAAAADNPDDKSATATRFFVAVLGACSQVARSPSCARAAFLLQRIERGRRKQWYDLGTDLDAVTNLDAAINLDAVTNLDASADATPFAPSRADDECGKFWRLKCSRGCLGSNRL